LKKASQQFSIDYPEQALAIPSWDVI